MDNHDERENPDPATTQEGETQALTPGVDFVVELGQLRDIDIDALLSASNSVDCHDINRIFSDLASSAEPEDQPPLQLPAGITNYHIQPDHRTEPFSSMFIFVTVGRWFPLIYYPSNLMPSLS